MRAPGRELEIASAAEQIGNVVSLIRDIAEQTNLLALNATIEAARAGELGKGFAVVAAEVKALASQTAKATQDISEQITGVQNYTRSAVSSIREISDAVAEINQVTTSIASAVEEQQAALQCLGLRRPAPRSRVPDGAGAGGVVRAGGGHAQKNSVDVAI